MSKKIFICEDNIYVLNALLEVLSVTGADLLTEQDSTLAMEGILRFSPDILICDIQMPRVSGTDLIRSIRKSDVLRDVFILCISASHNGREIAMFAGADAFLEKPFDIDDFLAALPIGPTIC